MADALARFHPPVGAWFRRALGAPTPAQEKGWAAIANGENALLLAPTGSGKTLAAFLAAIDRLMFSPEPPQRARCRVLYVSPLKALAVDVEKNLRDPIAGIAEAATLMGAEHRVPTAFVRSGDTPMAERAAAARRPPDIYITTPESLFLLLTQEARRVLASVEVVILDEIHALVPTKRGAHLAVSLERLEAERPRGAPPLQRVGLSATQRPLEEVARLLGGFERRGVARPVTIVDAGSKKQWELKVEVPEASTVATAAARAEKQRNKKRGAASRDGSAAAGLGRDADDARSVWPSIHARLVDLVRAHRSTMIFVNSRRLAERLAGAMNEIAGEDLALAHHGSVARETRLAVEDRLKKGELPAIVATSSLELGIDVGAVDLVVQIEAPPSVASGLQRIGRAGHQVGAVSRGVIFPKHRGDLLAAAAATKAMRAGQVEATHYPRSPLDVLAQQIVAIAAMDELSVDALFDLVTRAAPFADLARASFEGVLDMLSGRYPSDEFAELRPRVTYDRVNGRVRGRDGAKRLAVVSGGTIPDRGLYGVYLAGDEGARSRRVGELDEEMVFESRVGDVFLLGASSWRIEDITHDRVLVTPAPGAPGKMPFWHGDRAGRPAEFGAAIGALARAISRGTDAEGERLLTRDHDLDEPAARSLVAYVRPQVEATGEAPSDEAIVVERYRDEMGDFRVCVLSPFGARVHAPWCTAALARMKRDSPLAEVEGLWSDDGIVFRLPEADQPPDVARVVPAAAEIQGAPRRRALVDEPVRGALPRERGARAPLAAAPAGPALAALGAAQARARSARGRVALPGVPDPARDVPRVPARRVRSAGARGAPRARRAARDSARHGRHAAAVAVRVDALVLVRRELHLRRRRARGRAPRARARDRLGRARAAPRRGRAPRSARSDGDRGARATRAAARRGAPRARSRRRARPPARRRRPHAGRDRGARDARPAGRGVALRARPRGPRVVVRGRRRAPVRRDRGRRQARERARPPAAEGRARGAARFARERARRARREVRAHARPVRGRGRGGALRRRRRARAGRARAAGRGGSRAHGRLHAARDRSTRVRCRGP